jgi:hypothetical protein
MDINQNNSINWSNYVLNWNSCCWCESTKQCALIKVTIFGIKKVDIDGHPLKEKYLIKVT